MATSNIIKTNVSNMLFSKKLAAFFALFLLITVFTFEQVYAMPVVSFDSVTYTLSSGAVGASSIVITVTDSASNLDPLLIETIDVTVTSDTDSTGITITLTETGVNTGVFRNDNLIFTTGTGTFSVNDTIKAQINDPSANSSSSTQETVSVNIISSTDNIGISLTLIETGLDTGVFEETFKLISGTSTGNQIQVSDGDILSVIYPTNGEITNSLIIPNPNAGVGEIAANDGDTITATFGGALGTAMIVQPSPGGGGGSLVRSGLVVDSPSSGGNGCASDCTPPTLGLTNFGKRVVESGFIYNRNPIDVLLYYTPYPLVIVEVGKENVAILKVFEDSGMQNIRHVELGFGMGKDEVISQSKAVISYDVNFDGAISVSVYDPENALENVSVETRPSKCMTISILENCLELLFYHTFRAPLEFNMVGTNVWDDKRNSWQNYYNDGVEIVGKSLNPPKKIQALDRMGYPHYITLLDKQIAIDEDGHMWYKKDNSWVKEFIITPRDDPITTKGIDRNNNKFDWYISQEAKKAETTFNEIVQFKKVNNPDFGKNYASMIIPHTTSRSEDQVHQQNILDEKIKAEAIVAKLWPELLMDRNINHK